MKNKIYFFTSSMMGGAELVTLNYAKLIDKNEYEAVIVYTGIQTDYQKSTIYTRTNSYYLKVKKAKYSIIKYYKFIKYNKIKILFTSLLGISIPILTALYFNRKTKIIVRQSFMPNRYARKSLTTIGIMILYPRAFKIIAQTEEMKNMMIDYYYLKEDKIEVLQNPIDYERVHLGTQEESPYNKDNQEIIYVAIGNVRYIKGYDILVKAFKYVREINPNSHLFIVGEFSQSDEYFIKMQEWITLNNLCSYIHFAGFSSNPYKYIYNADCFVLSSRSEGLPNVLLEAMYLEKPVVATRCVPFIDRAINEGINGYKVEVENVKQMAEAMIKAPTLKITGANNYNAATAEEINALFR